VVADSFRAEPHRAGRLIAGIDEVGRGCIAGPVIAAAVILDTAKPVSGLTDSKKLSPQRREYLARLIRENSLDYAIGRAEASEIGRLNILQASLLAMARAVAMLSVKPDWVRVDGQFYPPIAYPGETGVKGDLLVAEISAASILAKVARDREMAFLDVLYPGYGLAEHKGYPTQLHLDRLQALGAAELHRKTFAPVKGILP
jgi:ribonuclease HII